MMTLGPLEYVAIGVPTDHALDEIIPTLTEIEETGALCVIDLLFVRTDAAGTVTVQEVSELRADVGPSSPGLRADMPGMLTAEDVQTLAGQMPANATAVVVLLEHLWARALTEAVKRANGVLYTGGLLPLDALAQVEAELAAAEAVAVP